MKIRIKKKKIKEEKEKYKTVRKARKVKHEIRGKIWRREKRK